VYLVGGPVRDLMLGRPVRDVDLLLEATGTEAEVLARAAMPKDGEVSVHDRFGTASLVSPEGGIDLATARREHYEHDGSLPRVEPAPVEEDLWRRDFSVNAIALPLSRAARTRITGFCDPTGGAADLEKRKLRVLHPRSFHDDPTRVLRAARLGPRLGFSLTRPSRSALRGALRDGAFGRVSGERLRRELWKLFGDAKLGLDPAKGLGALQDWHVLGALEPGLALERQSAPVLRRLGRTIATPPWRAPRWRPWISGFGIWLAPLGPGLRKRALRRLAVRGGPADRIAALPALCDRTLRSLGSARGRGAIDATLRELSEEELHALYAWADPAVRRRIARFAREDRHRRLPVSGGDLTTLGLEGPAIGKALDRIRSAVLDGVVSSREEALSLAREVGRRRAAPRS
jgi:tRNA nucleotidyltransferase (CCA-adding enzyme)